MSKREVILVLVSFAAFIWGVMVIVDMLEKQADTGLKVENMEEFVGQVNASVNDDPSKGLNDNLLTKARGAWGDDPFYPEGPVNFDPNETLLYQGFIRTGRQMFALVNNIEYQVGEEIEGRGLFVKSIAADRVVLVTPERKIRILPIQGDL